jgi:hypothetical protein
MGKIISAFHLPLKWTRNNKCYSNKEVYNLLLQPILRKLLSLGRKPLAIPAAMLLPGIQTS